MRDADGGDGAVLTLPARVLIALNRFSSAALRFQQCIANRVSAQNRICQSGIENHDRHI